MKKKWNKERILSEVSYLLYFIGAVIALFSNNTNLLLFIIVAVLLMRDPQYAKDQ